MAKAWLLSGDPVPSGASGKPKGGRFGAKLEAVAQKFDTVLVITRRTKKEGAVGSDHELPA